MIDLSHLTEEEQGVIMSVLRRDLELKKAEEERISKLEKILHSGSQSDTEMKYLTGEWFYEAKSRRHMDKIHGSEIILASMKQRKAALDGSLRIERSKTPSSRGSDIVGPPKPARCLESLQPPEFNDAEKENLNSGLRSPRTPRHNPFNRASLTVVEPPENNDDMSASRDRELSETELLSPLKSHPAGEVSQTSGGSVTSETSSVGFRPVPKKRTFLSRCTSSQSGSNGVGSDTQVSSNSSLERERNPHSLPRARPATYSRFDASSDRQTTQKSDERHEEQQRERAAVNTVILHTSSIQDSDRQNSVGTAMKQEELSLPQSTVDPDPPVSYDLNIVDKSDQQTQKKMDHRHMFKLSTQTTSPTGDEDAIAKVLDWFSRSTDSSEWLDTEDAPEATKSSEKHVEISKLRVGENDDEHQSPVWKALRRAEARPKNLAKSMEDITASISPRQERRQDPTVDMRRISDVSSIPSPSSSLFSDPGHLKKMSKSVPSFLQKEDVSRDADSNCEDSGRLTKGNSLTNLTSSTGMQSMSSLSGSVMTMYSGDFGNVEVQGNIQFSINYIQRLKEFHIFVAVCRDLAAVDPKRGRSDPYVKSYLVPDKANLGKRKTSVKKKTLNPIFNEILRYRVRMEYLRTQTLILSVWHHDTFGRNSFLGEVDVDLSKWDFDHTQMNYLALKARSTPTLAPSNGRGEMRLAIRFMPQIIHSEAKEGSNTGEVHIWVKECKNLPLIRATIDPYVKCFVLPDTSRKSRQKTRVLRRTADPAFNHTMVYDGIREADLAEACVELTVWDRDRLASNLLGGLRLGMGTGRSYGSVVDWMDSTPYEAVLWERMKATPNEWVEDILPLRMLNSAKTAFK
ncbi:synaptotagmin-like protein 2 isoform X4 [Chaetodon auriga]|uniref:synaptotagmin-like protein 2 isoform X4 n=1 Tax=Chaetodon auriga TaxID=39042 RepID=UPI004032AB5F